MNRFSAFLTSAPTPNHLAARSLKDMELSEELYKSDFEISARYDALATELVRLALLGVGAYGFFITKAGMEKDGSASHALKGFVDHPFIPALGLVALAISVGCALYCRYLNSRCLKLQIDILRLIGRIESGRWSDEDENFVNSKRLGFLRMRQARMLTAGKHLIAVAILCILIGAGATATSFVLALFSKP